MLGGGTLYVCVCVTFFGSDQIEITREKGAKETREPVDDSQYIRASLSMTAAAVRARDYALRSRKV